MYTHRVYSYSKEIVYKTQYDCVMIIKYRWVNLYVFILGGVMNGQTKRADYRRP